MVLSDNFKIAQFLGGEVKSAYSIDDVHTYMWYGETAHSWRKNKLRMNIGEALLEGHLEFHKSWDWLMPVVDKIESMGYIFNISKISVNIMLAKRNNDLPPGYVLYNHQFDNNGAQDAKFQAVYNLVISFIDNEEKLQERS